MKIFFNMRKFCNKVKPDRLREEEILIFIHKDAKRYYKMNVPFLIGYLGFSYVIISHPDSTSYIRNTSIFFSSVIALGLFSVFMYSNRHVGSIKLRRQSKVLVIETLARFGIKNKTFEVPISNLKEITSVKKYIKTNRTGIFMIKLNVKCFTYLNFFLIRPTKNNPEFDKIFKKLLI
jgi:hypothetical protein